MKAIEIAAALQDREKRLALPEGPEPYWGKIAPRVYLGYRRTAGGSSSWIARRLRASGQKSYAQERLGTTDDYQAADGDLFLDYFQARAALLKLARGADVKPVSTRRFKGAKKTIDDVRNEFAAWFASVKSKNVQDDGRLLQDPASPPPQIDIEFLRTIPDRAGLPIGGQIYWALYKPSEKDAAEVRFGFKRTGSGSFWIVDLPEIGGMHCLGRTNLDGQADGICFLDWKQATWKLERLLNLSKSARPLPANRSSRGTPPDDEANRHLMFPEIGSRLELAAIAIGRTNLEFAAFWRALEPIFKRVVDDVIQEHGYAA